MPRRARLQSHSGIYHVMLRGINRQIIFEDDGDKHYFMTVLKTCKELSGFKLYAFCLMSNHVHLLLKTGDEPLEQIFKRIGSRYVGWYNRKYRREGHLFQDRFRSENVETDPSFMTVLRYILQNPMKAGMEARPGSYRWSSYPAYAKGTGSVTDTRYALDLFGSHDTLIRFLNETNEDVVMDVDAWEWRLTDEQALDIMCQVSGCSCVSAFQQLELPVKKAFAREMYLNRMTIRQISRLTGMARTTIDRAIRSMDPASLLERQQLRLHESQAGREDAFPGSTPW